MLEPATSGNNKFTNKIDNILIKIPSICIYVDKVAHAVWQTGFG